MDWIKRKEADTKRNGWRKLGRGKVKKIGIKK